MTTTYHLHDELASYQEAGETLLATFLKAGLRAMLQLHISETCTTAIVMVSAMPPTVKAVLDDTGLKHSMVDWHDDERKTAATYGVKFAGHEVCVVAVKWHDERVGA